jgi:hypothetical protein
MLMWQFMALLFVHWIADFVLQTHWQAANKSKNLEALARHVVVYTAVLSGTVPIIFYNYDFTQWFFFVGVNFVLHFVTDFFTSKVTSKLFLAQFEQVDVGINRLADWRLAMKKNFNPHEFFVVIGCDQLIHQMTLAITGIWIFG